MKQELLILMATAASLGFFHTILGPDHYLPFMVMSKARKWSLFKTSWITVLCGLGHIGSSVILGMIGVTLGIAVSKFEGIESVRGEIAAWALILFGLIYFVWGLWKAIRNRPHNHLHAHIDGSTHLHEHVHSKEHLHVHSEERAVNITPWILFTIFLFGPCEPLIPLVMYPAAKHSFWGVILITSVFGGVTILTMLGIVLISISGINLLPIEKLEGHTHTLAGGAIFICGIGIKFLGL